MDNINTHGKTYWITKDTARQNGSVSINVQFEGENVERRAVVASVNSATIRLLSAITPND